MEHWVAAVEHHLPGALDPPAVEVASWSNADLQTLWIDVWTLAELMREPRTTRFAIRPEGQRTERQVYYTPNELKRMREFARDTAAAIDRDDLLRRGAILHADIAMTVAAVPDPIASANAFAPEHVTLRIGDGQGLDLGQTAIHWEFGHMLLDRVPRDATVRLWYRATSAWMQQHENHDLGHIERGRKIFPDDPDLLFLAGCLHETLASARIQAALRSMPVPRGFTPAVGSARSELHDAEGRLRQALEARADFAEARLHLGRVLDLLGDHQAAIRELEQAAPALTDESLAYDGSLFLGAAYEGAGRLDDARSAYDRAAGRFPDAQSPLLALAELARRRGDRAAALAAMNRMFALRDPIDRDDPFWRYLVSQGRRADEWLDELRRPFVPRGAR